MDSERHVHCLTYSLTAQFLGFLDSDMIVDVFKCFGNDLGMRCELAYIPDGRTEPNTAQVNINICCKKKIKKIVVIVS